MNVAYINPFITATINLFKTMLTLEVKPGPPQVKTEPLPTYEVSGIIGLSGDAQGSISISFPKITALRVVSRMLGMEIKVVGPDMTDGIGEIANIIAGNAKQGLESFNLSISLPSVIVGHDHMLATQQGIPTLIVPFTSSLGNFTLEVRLRTKA